MHTFIILKGGDGIGRTYDDTYNDTVLAPHLISVVKYEKYALRGVLDFFGGGSYVSYFI